ncbi:hypothetical protein [Dokdonia sp. Hel_I_53]|uniref:hypothetical protein n=1 Tax=Dokdonia sp. Hel_I_53 TaxID=1566287 RepID=UPI00119C03F2|nr:hypothetical protein [Dokdonia sp. Hel_I_53]TVZ53260.1 hypothetical protein OD90_2460 [Dokdonia sp. Hel_I_53]
MLYYYKATGKLNILLFIMLFFAMVAEVLFQYNYYKFIEIVSISALILFICMIYLLKPIIHFNSRSFAKHNLTELTIGFLIVAGLLMYCLYVIIPSIPNLFLFLPAVIGFVTVLVILYGVPQFNNNPSNLLLTGVASALLVEMLVAFAYEFILDLDFFLVVAILFGAAAKIFFTMFLIRMKDVGYQDHFYF